MGKLRNWLKMLDEEYKCLNYKSLKQCKTCDGFARNSDEKIDVIKCYNGKTFMIDFKFIKEEILIKKLY